MLTEQETKALGKFTASINVAQLLKEAIGASRHYQLREISEGSLSPWIRGDITLTRSREGILVKAIITTQIEAVCSRCLIPFNLGINFSLEEEFLPTVDVFTGLPLAIPKESENFLIDGNHILDLSEALRQYFLLAIPLKPLCQPNCAGLCSVCGYNLNLGTCSCLREVRDQRWSKLKELRFSEKE